MPLKLKYRSIMVVGTGSHVGKSVVVTGLCRAYARQGIDAAPFKAQNMALNSGITVEGGEIGRAQITQAEAAGLEPHVDMNPILLKPTSDLGSQVILLGRVLGSYKAADYYGLKPKLTRKVMAAFRRLQEAHQLVIIEGAGSCAEVNLKKHDLANMALARRTKAKVVLVADIDAGGVFAQVVGSFTLLSPAERRLVAGVIINKFRGEAELFRAGVDFLEKQTSRPVLGVLPMFDHIHLPQEDGVVLERGETRSRAGQVRVGVVCLSRISNFTDADPLAAEEAVDLRWINSPGQLAGLDLLILPGTKNTLAALSQLEAAGLDRAVKAFHGLGGKVLGLCGGYQLLGRRIADTLGVEDRPAKAEGLGLLDVETIMAAAKTTTRVEARTMPGLPFGVRGVVRGYEIHMGQTRALSCLKPAFGLVSCLGQPVSREDGHVSPDGRVVGTYLHGLLDNDDLRAALLGWAKGGAKLKTGPDFAAFKDKQYHLLADLIEENLNLSSLLEPKN